MARPTGGLVLVSLASLALADRVRQSNSQPSFDFDILVTFAVGGSPTLRRPRPAHIYQRGERVSQLVRLRQSGLGEAIFRAFMSSATDLSR